MKCCREKKKEWKIYAVKSLPLLSYDLKAFQQQLPLILRFNTLLSRYNFKTRVREKHYPVKITREKKKDSLQFFQNHLITSSSVFPLNVHRAKHLFLPVFFSRGIGGAILFLMLCAAIYEYKATPSDKDAESLSVSNNNERLSNFSNKNLNQDHGVVQENGEELIEKGKSLQKDLPDHSKKSKKGKIRTIRFYFYISNSLVYAIFFRRVSRLLDHVSDGVQSHQERGQDYQHRTCRERQSHLFARITSVFIGMGGHGAYLSSSFFHRW